MLKYKGVDCPYCHKEFQPTDEILICPECGAPYHRECVRESGGCVLTELHERGEQWEAPKRPTEEDYFSGMDQHRCPRCGTQNPPDRLFCEVCGDMLHEPKKEPGQDPESWVEEDRSAPPFQMPYNPYTTPFGGLNADEVIDDVPVRDLAIYVRENSHFFLPKFKDFFSKKAVLSWNWPCFLLDFYYLMYRKMWGLGAIVLVLSLLLSAPSTLLSLESMMLMVDEEASIIATMNISPEKLVTLTNFCSFLSMVMKFALASLVNRFYARKVMRDVKKLRAEKGSDPAYTTLLSEKGGTSRLAVILCIAATFVASMALSAVLTSVIMSISGF
ncbi:MAG: zinc ribbon domain-containing protein [Oscillospiraceae bacterium]|nr:zinc ribbon domain-containing protein [Oscillospiraceae bacterium]